MALDRSTLFELFLAFVVCLTPFCSRYTYVTVYRGVGVAPVLAETRKRFLPRPDIARLDVCFVSGILPWDDRGCDSPGRDVDGELAPRGNLLSVDDRC